MRYDAIRCDTMRSRARCSAGHRLYVSLKTIELFLGPVYVYGGNREMYRGRLREASLRMYEHKDSNRKNTERNRYKRENEQGKQ